MEADMGTRADFYIGRGETAEWLGSIGWDGYPDGIDAEVLTASSEDGFRAAVSKFIAERNDTTLPSNGWPWPWKDSGTTDYTYAFDGKVFASSFGYEWFDPTQPEPESNGPKVAIFPDMSGRSNFTLGPRSGVIVVAA